MEVAKSNKRKQKENTESNTNKPPQTVDHSQHNPENRNINTNSNLERKLDLILNKLDSMQKSINNLNDRIKKLEEWRAQFINDSTPSQQSDTAPLIDLNTPSSSPTKRIRVSTSSSSDSDDKGSPVSINTPKSNPLTLLNKQSNVIKDQQEQLNQCMAEISRLTSLINQ